jgi:hypothetical protein
MIIPGVRLQICPQAAGTTPLGLPEGGMVGHFDIPNGWKNDYIESRRPYQCRPRDGDCVSVTFEGVAIPVGVENRSKLQRLLFLPNHTFTTPEVAWLQHLLNANGSDPLVVSSARSRELNYNRVLDVTGKFTFPGRVFEFRRIYIDVDFTCDFLQHVTYSAPTELFQRYYKQADELIDSMTFSAVSPPYRNSSI